MKVIMFLMVYLSQSNTLVSMSTAEFDDVQACNAAYTATLKMVQSKLNERFSVYAECVPKSSGPPSTAAKK